jgi:chemotaxis protein methyltransferase CheR
MLMVGHTESMTPPEGCVLEWVGDTSGFRKPREGAETRVVADPEAAAPGPDPVRLLEQAWNDVVAERYEDARRRLDPLPLTGEALRLAAWIAVCRGEWDPARDLAERAVTGDVAHPENHFVAAMAALGMGRGEEAAAFLKRAVYLDPDFSVAHFHLAELEARRGNERSARRAWRNAARASGGDGTRIQRYLGGFDAAALAQACEGRCATGGPP